MKRFVFAIMLVLAIVGSATVTLVHRVRDRHSP